MKKIASLNIQSRYHTNRDWRGSFATRPWLDFRDQNRRYRALGVRHYNHGKHAKGQQSVCHRSTNSLNSLPPNIHNSDSRHAFQNQLKNYNTWPLLPQTLWIWLHLVPLPILHNITSIFGYLQMHSTNQSVIIKYLIGNVNIVHIFQFSDQTPQSKKLSSSSYNWSYCWPALRNTSALHFNPSEVQWQLLSWFKPWWGDVKPS